MTSIAVSSPVKIEEIERLAIKAGRAIMQIRARGFEKNNKSDGSPVTEADLAADQIINERLAELTPELPRITEETWQSSEETSEPRTYWCVDPLDGTKGFINGGKDFTVNIALIHERFPLLGVIYAPATGKLWAGGHDHDGTISSWKRASEITRPDFDDFTAPTPLRVRHANLTNPVIVATKAHRSPRLEHWINTLNASSAAAVGSSLKFCELAEGKADLYPRIGPTMEWDTAAGQAILEAAGGMMVDERGARFSYGKSGRLNGAFSALAKLDGDLPSSWLAPQGGRYA